MEWNKYYEDQKVKPYAFEKRKDLYEVSLPEETKEIGVYAFSECRNLKRIKLPYTIWKIGAHAFYNCRGLECVTLSAQIKEIEDGAFKNCDGIKEIIIENADPHQLNILHLLLFEITQCVKVTLLFFDGTAVLVFPAYHYSYVANEPARIFSEVSHGAGVSFRECFQQKEVNFRGYDQNFLKAVREESFETVLTLAENRVLFPYQITKEAKNQYILWLRESTEKLIQYHANNQEIEILEKLSDAEVLIEKWLDRAAEIATQIEKPACTAVLLQIKRRLNTNKKKKYKFFDL